MKPTINPVRVAAFVAALLMAGAAYFGSLQRERRRLDDQAMCRQSGCIVVPAAHEHWDCLCNCRTTP